MGFLDDVGMRIDQVRYRDYADATIAVCALVSAADGGKRARSQRSKVADLVVRNPVLASFPAGELRDRYDHLCEEIGKDKDFGRAEALQAVARLADRPDQARSVVECGLEVARADGYVSRAEKAALRDACETVNLLPADFGL